MKIPPQLKNVIESLRQLPALGPRQATRLAFYLSGAGRTYGQQLARDISELSRLSLCQRCFFICDREDALCSTCADPTRNHAIILVVEKETDLLSLEEAGVYKGAYFVLGTIGKTGTLAPWQQERITAFKKRISADFFGALEEIIIGFSPSVAGDVHASIVKKELTGYAKKISRLGRGLPTGGEVEFADPETLSASLERRA